MDVSQVLYMNGGMGDSSYSNNSILQRKVISMEKPIIEEAITDVYNNIFPNIKTLNMADLGCSSGQNTLFLVSEILNIIDNLRPKQGNDQSPEFQIYLNDLSGNDFNTIFLSLPKFQENLKRQMGSGFGPCFFNGVPGSFYGRIFASRSLHFVHSSYSLHWLSQVPKGVEKNKGNICISSRSPPNVLRAYYEQFQRDFSRFLMCRSEEMVYGGHMVLTFLGRKSEDPSSKGSAYILELLATVLREMVSEGSIDEENLDSFNVPEYTPTPKEVELEVEKEGSFMIDRLELSNVHWNASNEGLKDSSKESCGYNVAKCMRAVLEPMLASHFGKSIMDELFVRYGKIIAESMSTENTEYDNLTISMTRKKINMAKLSKKKSTLTTSIFMHPQRTN